MTERRATIALLNRALQRMPNPSPGRDEVLAAVGLLESAELDTENAEGA